MIVISAFVKNVKGKYISPQFMKKTIQMWQCVVLFFYLKVYSASVHDEKKPLKYDTCSSAFSKDLNWRHVPPKFMKERSLIGKRIYLNVKIVLWALELKLIWEDT